jgi:putative serine protease PepD
MQALQELGDSVVQAVDRAGPSVVRVEGARAIASGFVWDDQGTVLTTERLVGACRGEVAVTLASGERRAAELLGRDRVFDLAVLRVARAGLAPIARHAADDLKVGQPVVALARPGAGLRASLRIIGLLARDVPLAPHLEGGPAGRAAASSATSSRIAASRPASAAARWST